LEGLTWAQFGVKARFLSGQAGALTEGAARDYCWC
jgi:hypothetical protein